LTISSTLTASFGTVCPLLIKRLMLVYVVNINREESGKWCWFWTFELIFYKFFIVFLWNFDRFWWNYYLFFLLFFVQFFESFSSSFDFDKFRFLWL
jgi:hypothetical protein